jgi:hypothetical protein
MDNKSKGYIYCLITREFIEEGKIYKIGRTSKEMYETLAGYSKGTKVLAYYYCKNIVEAKRELKKKFIDTFTQRAEYGSEYFEGKIEEIISTMHEVLQKYYTTFDYEESEGEEEHESDSDKNHKNTCPKNNAAVDDNISEKEDTDEM